MIYISVGSNLGNRIDNLRLAVDLLTKRCLHKTRVSIVLETEAILPATAPDSWNKPFLNMIIAGETNLSPDEMLTSIKAIEHEIGRPQIYERWAPRIIDLDILSFDDLTINTPNLVIPHPEISNRQFLQHLLSLIPLAVGDLGSLTIGIRPRSRMKDTLLGLTTRSTAQISNCESYMNAVSFTKSFVLHPALVGVVNVTTDSFSDGGQFNQADKAIAQIYKLVGDGASVIEIGAQSTRPGAVIQTPEHEYNKLKTVLDCVSDVATVISIDSFWPSVVRKLLQEHKISWINDVKGDFDDQTLEMIAESGCKFCFMHSLSIPPHPDTILPLDQRPIELLKEWGEIRIERLMKLGFAAEDIIFDPGIGFGKSPHQNMEILRCTDELKVLGVPIMIGHSRKSYIRSFSAEEAHNRDIETIAISLALKDKVDFLRVHNVHDHMRSFVAHEIFYSGKS